MTPELKKKKTTDQMVLFCMYNDKHKAEKLTSGVL